MWRDAWFVGFEDVRHMLRRRETLMWTFLMPIVFFFFIGTATGGFRSSMGADNAGAVPLTLVAPDDAGFMTDAFAARLVERGYEVRRVTPGDSITTTRTIRLPSNFTDSLLAAHAVKVRFERSGEGLSVEYDRFKITRALYTALADMLTAVVETHTPTPAAVAAVRATPQPIHVEVSMAGRRREIPAGFAQAIPGTMVMFTVLVMLSSSAVLLVVERREGLLRRMASTPITRGELVFGKWIGRMLLGCVQIAFAMVAGTLLFKMDWGAHVPAVLLLLFAYAGTNASLGLLLGSLATSQGQAVGVGVLSANVLAALGGCWWPIEVTPDWMQHFALFLPTGLAMDAIHKLVSFGAMPVSIVPHVGVLAAVGLAIGWLAARRFRYT